jgi:hypothetical protein
MKTHCIHFPENHRVQAAAKEVLQELAGKITAQSTERTIAVSTTRMLAERGFPCTWYYDCPALVLLGNRTCESISGRTYEPKDLSVGLHNLITVDLSPADGPLWGDCARAYYVENGVVVFPPTYSDFAEGHRVENLLHSEMKRIVNRQTTFDDLFHLATDIIESEGYENLDSRGNLGHSIAQRLEDRSYIEDDNRRLLSEVPYFTFEPHIRKKKGTWGFKHEDLYYFDDNNRIAEL